MTDFDPDAYLQSGPSSASFDPDAYLSQAPAPVSAAPPAKPEPIGPGNVDLFGDMGKSLIGGIVHGAGTLADVATGTAPGQGSHADRWAAPFAITDRLGQLSPEEQRIHQAVSNTYDKVAGTGPGAAEIKTRIPQALEAIGTVVPVLKGVGGALTPAAAIDAQAALDARAANSSTSMGASAAAPKIAAATPPLQQAIRDAVKQPTGTVNLEAVHNHLEADQHGVHLMEGQATRDPIQFSNEQNSTHPDVVKRINVQNQQLTDAIDNVRREAAPGAVQNDPIENGQTAVNGLKAYDEPIKADIKAKYDAAKAASASGDLQMDGSSFVSDANAALKPQSKFRFLPANVKGILDDVANADGKMNLDDYQAYDTQLGAEIRKAKRADDGNAVAAITKVQDALNNIKPIGAETAQAKSLFDTARSSAKARFDELRADPAYRAAVDDVADGVAKGEPSALADKFLDKYALQAPKANVDRLMTKLDPDSQQAITAHTLSTIRKSAVTANGSISPHGFNSAMEKYGPKLDSLVSPDTIESLDSLGRVITNAKVPPAGHLVNSSKSGVLTNAAQGASNIIQGGAEALINAKTFGLGIPVVKGIAEGNWAKRTLAPGAGITKAPQTP